MYSSPVCVIWPLLFLILSLPSMVQVRESPLFLNVAVALLPSLLPLNESPSQSLSVRNPTLVF